MKFTPELSAPHNSTAAGALSSIPIKDLFIEELTSRPGFRVLLLTMGGIPTNKAAARMLVSELQIYPDLLVLTSLCSSQMVCNATRWGLGIFPHGKYPRAPRGLEAVLSRNFRGHVDKMLKGAALLLNEPLAQSDSFDAYVGDIQDEYLPNIDAHENTRSPQEFPPPDGRPGIRDIWKKFARLVTGQRGTFAKKPKRADKDDLANRCFELGPSVLR